MKPSRLSNREWWAGEKVASRYVALSSDLNFVAGTWEAQVIKRGRRKSPLSSSPCDVVVKLRIVY